MIVFLLIGLAVTSIAVSTPREVSTPTTQEIYESRGGNAR